MTVPNLQVGAVLELIQQKFHALSDPLHRRPHHWYQESPEARSVANRAKRRAMRLADLDPLQSSVNGS